MKAGGDNDGIWTIIESGLRYVSAPNGPFTRLILFPSISGAVAHVPYIMPLLTAMMGQNGSMQRSRTFGKESVLRRLELGANRKDLFYYLVWPTPTVQLPHFIGIDYRAARSFLSLTAPQSRRSNRMD